MRTKDILVEILFQFLFVLTALSWYLHSTDYYDASGVWETSFSVKLAVFLLLAEDNLS